MVATKAGTMAYQVVSATMLQSPSRAARGFCGSAANRHAAMGFPMIYRMLG